MVVQDIGKIYEEIQERIYYMIPEKWEKLYLYASIIDRNGDLQTGEMYFYYFPKGMFKTNPINVYEIPSRFNIDEDDYSKLVNELYSKLKELRNAIIKIGEPAWSNLTISIENSSFKIQYEYDDLTISDLNSYYRHLLWRYKYLGIPLSTYSRKDRVFLAKYLATHNKERKKVKVYTQGIYKEKNYKNIIEYNHEENETNKEIIEDDSDNSDCIKSQILKSK